MTTSEVEWRICDCGAVGDRGRLIHPYQPPCVLATEPEPDPVLVTELVTLPAVEFPDLRARYVEWLRTSNSPRQDPHENHASQLGDPCTRRIYLDRTGAEKEAPDDELLGVFQLGHDWEELARIAYRRMGFRLELGQQRFRVLDEDGSVLWVGMTDGVLVDEVTGERYAHDTKTTRDAERLGSQYEAKYRAQIQLYMSRDALDLDRGMVVLWDKGSGIPLVLTETRSDAEYQRLRSVARELNRAVAAKEPPPFCSDPTICKSCPFRGLSCHPSVTVDAIGLIADPEVSARLVEVLELEEFGKRHKELSEALKERFKGNADGIYLSPDGITVRVKRNKAGACSVTWERKS